MKRGEKVYSKHRTGRGGEECRRWEGEGLQPEGGREGNLQVVDCVCVCVDGLPQRSGSPVLPSPRAGRAAASAMAGPSRLAR